MTHSIASLTFLGTGTSNAIPMIACDCQTCTSHDPHDQRGNSSLLITTTKGKNILIDCGKDFRIQAIREKVKNINAVLLTHDHADHIMGLDELRVFNHLQKESIPIYGKEDHLSNIKNYTFRYLFDSSTQKGGGIAKLELMPIMNEVRIDEIDFKVLVVKHGKLDIFAYRFGDMAYISDVSEIPPQTMAQLQGLDLLILDALRFREHSTHFNFTKALETVAFLKPKRTFFIHMSHDVKHHETQALFKDPKSEYFSKHDVSLAHDGLKLNISHSKSSN
ncbi:MAG: MBL fold metallo-hydrolase [Planctomycetes bacterium]|nr:MBL fold metallo-hydrolase [Planctomycetota bacterium]